MNTKTKRNAWYVDYGFEYEFFAACPKEKKVYNATHLINKFFERFTQDQNLRYLNYTTGLPVLLSNSSHDLVADGTAFEIICNYVLYGGNFTAKQTNSHINFYRSYIEKMLNVPTLLTPYISTEDGYEFLNPGDQFSGKKIMANAYSGKAWRNYKKLEPKPVSFRTVGFHIHIRFRDKEDENKMFNGYDSWHLTSAPLCNALIQELDSVYHLYLSYLSSEDRQKELLRTSRYATLGNYRIKEHGDYKTLEYRQFSSAFLTLPFKQQDFLMEKFHNIIINFLNTIPK